MVSKLTDLNCKYGAPMGRASRDAGEEKPILELQRVELDAGGYDSGGAYWGIPNNLWRYESESGETEGFIRADSRAEARADLQGKFPNATIQDAESTEGLDDFTTGYILAALWTNTGPDFEEEGLGDDGELSDVAPESLARVVKECKAWQNENAELLALAYATGYDAMQAGHDFWLTHNGHGAGFWDRTLLDTRDESGDTLGERLSKAAGRWESYLYRGDDGLIWFE